MKTHKRRNAPQAHIFAGESEGLPLVRFLNSNDQGKPREDIAEALVTFRQVREAVAGQLDEKKDLLDAFAAAGDAIEKIQQVSSLLGKYKFRPVLSPYPTGGYSSVVNSKSMLDRNSISFRWVPAWTDAANPYHEDYGPGAAILDLMRLVEKGLLSAVKQCICGTWIFARFPQAQHCSVKCRVKAHRSKPGWKDKRREWRKSNRVVRERLESGGREAAKKSAKRHGGRR
jgi:hypothetical protein